ncbi:MAG: hypothetical protein E6G44_05005 [Actinobacteria bacterium]|nr:MAG: hypothetical protein E6G44_05005 [Actinomycetota bacterium]
MPTSRSNPRWKPVDAVTAPGSTLLPPARSTLRPSNPSTAGTTRTRPFLSKGISPTSRMGIESFLTRVYRPAAGAGMP